MVFPVVTYRYESWTIKKAERRRIDTFGLWCWRRLLRVPWTARRPNQSVLKEINLEYSLEGLMLKLQSFGCLIWRMDSIEKIPMLEKIEGRRRRGQQRMRWLCGITDSVDVNLRKLWEIVKYRGAWWAAIYGVAQKRTRLKWLSSSSSSSSSLKFMCIELMMPSNHLILCRPLFLLPSIFPRIRVFSNESVLCVRWPKCWSFSFSISP